LAGRPNMASFQPPAYQAHEMSRWLSRLPIVGVVWDGRRRYRGMFCGYGGLVANIVFTA
jgi:hypothetical protein